MNDLIGSESRPIKEYKYVAMLASRLASNARSLSRL